MVYGEKHAKMDLPDQSRPATALHCRGARANPARDRRADRDHRTRRPPHRRRARGIGLPLPQAQRPAQPLHDQATPSAAGLRRPRAADRRATRRTRQADPRQRENRSMTGSDHLEQLRAEAAYRRQRLDLYRAKAYGPRPTTAARLPELEREYELAASRLKRATAKEPDAPKS